MAKYESDLFINELRKACFCLISMGCPPSLFSLEEHFLSPEVKEAGMLSCSL